MEPMHYIGLDVHSAEDQLRREGQSYPGKHGIPANRHDRGSRNPAPGCVQGRPTPKTKAFRKRSGLSGPSIRRKAEHELRHSQAVRGR